jgi:hypothetical protein
MSRYIIIQETGSDHVLVVDKDSNTVEQINVNLLDDVDDDTMLGAAIRGDQPVMMGISAAIASTQRLELSGRQYFAA